MIRLGLIGWPLAHSLSPVLHQRAGEISALPVDYQLYPTPPDRVNERLADLREAGLRGVNVTIPHKAAAAAWVDRLTPQAARLGAVNTVVFEPDGTATGHNTDVAGVRESLGSERLGRAVLVGAGGAARAALVALAERCDQIHVLARRLQQAETLVASLAPERAIATPLSALAESVAGSDLVVDALPPQAEHVARAPLHRLSPQGRVLTLNYGPGAAATLQAAGRAGRPAMDGLIMLAAQGVAAFELWTGRRVATGDVLASLQAASRRD